MKIVVLEPIGANEKKLGEFEAKLKELGHELVVFDSIPSDNAEIIKRAGDADVILLSIMKFDALAVEGCKNLKLISVAFTGFDHIAIDKCKEKGIVVSNASGYSNDSVAELTFMLILSLYRKLIACDKVTREGGTKQGLMGSEIKGKTLGIIGTGAIGLRVAELGKSFGCNLVGFNRSEKDDAKKLGLKYLSLEEVLKTSDIITIHTPLTPQTKDMIGKNELAMMKKNAVLIQVARGGIVNEEALAEALDNGIIAGAGIDVFTEEPPLDPNKVILKAKNTVVTPHVAFATFEALDKRADIVFDNVYSFFEKDYKNRVA